MNERNIFRKIYFLVWDLAREIRENKKTRKKFYLYSSSGQHYIT